MDEVRKKDQWVIRLSMKRVLMLLPGIFYIANLVRMLMFSSMPYFITLFAVGGLGFLMALLSRKYNLPSVLVFFAVYMLTLAANWVTIGNISFSSIAVNLFLIGITIVMLKQQWGYREGIIVFYVTVLLMNHARNASAVRRILVSSTNYISVVMLLAVSFYYIAVERERRKLKLLDVLPAVICFLFSVWARGRGGILSSTVLLVLILFLFMKTVTDKKIKWTIVIVFALLVVGVVLIVKNISLLDTFMSLGKWGTRGADNSSRMYIWGSYFSKLKESLWYVLFGAPLDKIPAIAMVGENCHNSFLQLHAYNGLLMFIIFLYLMVKSFIYYMRKKQYVMAAMMFVLVLRGMTDKFIFGQYGMPIMLYFVLYPWIERQHMREDCFFMSLSKGGHTK